MKYLLIFFLISANLNLWGYQPSLESILRNPNNQDIEMRGIVLTFDYQQIIRLPNQDGSAASSLISDSNEVSLVNKSELKGFAKYVYYLNESLNLQSVIQLHLADGTSNEKIVDLKVFNSAQIDKLDLNEKNLVRTLNAVLNVLVLNNPESLLKILKSLDPNIEFNRERINKRKLNLLHAYKQYQVKKKSSSGDEIKSPWKSDDENRQLEIDQVLKEPLIQAGNDLILRRSGAEFHWVHESEFFNLTVDHETRRIQNLKIRLNNQDFVEFVFKDYIMFNGTHELPKFIFIFTPNLKLRLTTVRHQHFNDNINLFRNRLKTYSEGLKQNNSRAPKPDFLL